MNKTIKAVKLMALVMTAGATLHAANITPQANTIYITGSTGFRGTVNTYLWSQYSNNLACWDASTNTYAAAAGAKALAFTNVTVNGSQCDIIISWYGSEAGIQNTMAPTSATNKKQAFYDLTKIPDVQDKKGYTNTYAAGPGNGTTGGKAWMLLTNAAITFADNPQSLSVFGPASGAAPDGITYLKASSTGCKGQVVAVVPFNIWIQNGAKYTNMTQSAWYNLLSKGVINGAELTGVQSDTNDLIYLVGRNIDSGTRVNMHLATHFPTSLPALQYMSYSNVAGTGGGGTFPTKYIDVETNGTGTINGITVPAGSGGESSGGTIAGWLTNAPVLRSAIGANHPWSATLFPSGATGNVYAVSYIALGDAFSKIATNGVATGSASGATLVPMALNGIVGRGYSTNYGLDFFQTNTGVAGATATNTAYYSPDDNSKNLGISYLDLGFTNITTGTYPYFGYVTTYYNTNWAPNGTSAAATTNLWSTLATVITNKTSTDPYMYGAIKLSDMKVYRPAGLSAAVQVVSTTNAPTP